DPKAEAMMRELYAPFVRTGKPILVMDHRSAEITKYAANAMLAARISFMNEIANLCDRVGADVQQVRQGVGTDVRIGSSFLFPGVGYGGSCLPKDVKALIRMGRDAGMDLAMASAIDRSYEAVEGADALAVVTEWSEFREPDFARIKALMRTPVIFDGRNLYNPRQLRELGFQYEGIGRR